MKTKKQKLILVLIIGIFLSFIPFPTTVAPEWKLKVINENGEPFKNQIVRQFCENYTLGVSPCDSEDSLKRTDENGYVSFPERKIWMSFSMRIIRSFFNYLMLIAHGSVGTKVFLDSSGPNGYKTLEYDSWKPLPKEFILPAK